MHISNPAFFSTHINKSFTSAVDCQDETIVLDSVSTGALSGYRRSYREPGQEGLLRPNDQPVLNTEHAGSLKGKANFSDRRKHRRCSGGAMVGVAGSGAADGKACWFAR